MSILLAFIVAAVLFLSYSNGANDNFKGVATLYGSGATRYWPALIWATATTLSGSLLALVLAQGLVEAFKGKGLVPDPITHQPAFLLAVSLGAALTVLIATFAGLPVSTTHALTGGLVGAGVLAAAGDIHLGVLGTTFVLPLLASPVAAMLLTIVVYFVFRLLRKAFGVFSRACVRLDDVYEPVKVLPDGDLLVERTGARLERAPTMVLVDRYEGKALGLPAGRVLDVLHFLSGGAVGFSRGLNDTPKIVALMLACDAIHPTLGLALTALVMALGGILNARRVAQTMSRKITFMNPGQGFTANLVTAILVGLASPLKLPVSTTHVSVGALFGVGVVNRTARIKTILVILLAWVTTLPMAACLSAGVYLLLQACGVGM